MKQNQKPCTKTKKVINRRKRTNILSEVNPDENIETFLEISPMQKQVLPSHKLWGHAYECQNPFGFKEEVTPHREIVRIDWVIQVCLTYSRNVRRVWFKERFTVKKIWMKDSNIRKGHVPKHIHDWEHPKNAQFDTYEITSNFFNKFQWNFAKKLIVM